MKERYIQAIYNQKHNLQLPETAIERDVFSEFRKYFFADNRINIITGLRRTGKSTLIKQLMLSLDNYVFINFDDERLLGFQAQDFELLNEAVLSVYGQSNYYFFDEVQNVPSFEVFVRRLHDEGKKVVITGSNSSLLSMEFGTRLTGRYKIFELFPFSFTEFLKFKGINYDVDSFYITERKVEIIRNFSLWFEYGSLPEFLNFSDNEYVKTLFDNIIYRDIIARYGIRKINELKELVLILTSYISLPITYNSLKNSLNLSNSDTVREYLSYLSNSWMIFELKRFDNSIKQQLKSPRKIYLIDIAFNRLVGFNTSENIGRRLENIVFIILRRITSEIYFFSQKGECDFIIKSPDLSVKLFQVCYLITDENKSREVNGLLEAMEYFDTRVGTILTYNQEEKIKLDDKTIEVIPVWKWALVNKLSTSNP